MKFESFIIEKLYEGETINLEDLGKIHPVDKQTTIHPGSHEFDPPGRTVSFEYNTDEKDTGFAEFVASQTNQDKEKVLSGIKKWAANIKEQLNNGNKVQLQNIGILVLNSRNNVALEVDKSKNFSKKFYGLPQFQQEVISAKSKKTPQEKSKQSTGKKTTEKKSEKSIPKEKTKKQKSGKKKSWVVPVILILFIAAAGWYVQNEWKVISELNIPRKKTYTTDQKQAQESVSTEKQDPQKPKVKNSDREKIQSNNKDDSSPDKKETVEKSDKDQTIEEDSDKSDKTKKIQSGDYLIIAGCFDSYKNAKDLVKELKQKGYPASIQGKTPEGLHRVAYNYYSDKQKATSKLNELKNKGKKGIWLDRY